MAYIPRFPIVAILAFATLPLHATAQSISVPKWLAPHVGFNDGQIAPVVLERARALHQEKLRSGKVTNPCFFAMDATRPSTTPNGDVSRRFYVICEGQRTFRAVSSGYGSGRDIPKANFRNGRQCAKHFSNAEGSNLTSGGSYVTSEVRTSYKGYFSEGGQTKPFVRPFLAFDGEGENKNARKRFIGGHEATFLRSQCLLKRPNSKYANDDGFVRFGRLVNYSAGRSNGCTTWTSESSDLMMRLAKDNPTTLYIYPESKDIKAVASAVKKRQSVSAAGLYWNATCLANIGTPQFWSKRKLEPMIKRWRRSLTPSPRKELPICQ